MPGAAKLEPVIVCLFEYEIIGVVIFSGFGFSIIGQQRGADFRKQIGCSRGFAILELDQEDVARSPFDSQGYEHR